VNAREMSAQRAGRGLGAALTCAVALLGVGTPQPARAQQQVPVRAAVVNDLGPDGGTPRAVSIWVHPQDVARSAVLVAEGRAGVGVYALDGGLVSRPELVGEAADVDVALAPLPALGVSSLVLVVDTLGSELALLTVDPQSGTLSHLDGSPFPEGTGVTLGALFVPPGEGRAYVFAADLGGVVRQWELVRSTQGTFSLSPVRSFQATTTGGLQALAVDDGARALYVADAFGGVQRYPAAPDAGSLSSLVVAPGAQALSAGLGLYTASDGGGYVLVADSLQNQVGVYPKSPSAGPASGFLRVLPPDGGTQSLPVDRVAVEAFGLGATFPTGLLVTSGREGQRAPISLVRWGDVASAFSPDLVVDPSSDPRGAPTADAGTPQDAGADGGSGGVGGLPGGGGGGGGGPRPPEGVGCNCSASGGATALMGLAALLVALGRRR
jgi:MYXO-CTERM domain-containing protein